MTKDDTVNQDDVERAAREWLDDTVSATSDEEPSDIAYSADQMVDAFMAGATKLAASEAREQRLREELAKEREPHWFYLGDDCSSENCRFGIDEVISEDFEWNNDQKGEHVLQISGARPVPDMWVALHYFTEAEKDGRCAIVTPYHSGPWFGGADRSCSV